MLAPVHSYQWMNATVIGVVLFVAIVAGIALYYITRKL